MCSNITANDRGYSSCISLRLGACYALRFMGLKADKLQLCVNIPINSIAHNDGVCAVYSMAHYTLLGAGDSFFFQNIALGGLNKTQNKYHE